MNTLTSLGSLTETIYQINSPCISATSCEVLHKHLELELHRLILIGIILKMDEGTGNLQ